MKLPREEVIRRALLAASAVTGRARRFATTAAVGSAVSLAAWGCSSPNANTNENTMEGGNNGEEAQKEEPTCVDPDGGLSDYQCCAEHNFEVAGCEPCSAENPNTCLDCMASTANVDPTTLDPNQPDPYMACCDVVRWDYNYGCQAWGPPAPPAFAGRTLDDILGSTHILEAA